MEALLGGLREQIYNDIAGFVAAQQAEVREERAAREAAERERQKQLLTAVSAAITRDLPVQIEKILKKELKGIAGEIGKVVTATKDTGGGDADAKALAAALPKALAAAMTTTVVPKFEKATSEMFAQVKSTFERGMDELAAELYTQKENAVAAEVGPLVHTLRGATDEVRVAAEMLVAGGASNAPGGEASSLAELESRMDPTVALGASVDAGDFEGAFTKALGMSSVDVVAWVCSRADAKREAIFSSTPAALSQGVLLSLAQQLSSDLTDEPELKIAWIRDAALAIDPSDAALAQHMRPILEAVFAGLHECATAPETPAPVKNDLRLCIHVVNSLLTACK
jgi:enhancer of mRNA-decapping protein 4